MSSRSRKRTIDAVLGQGARCSTRPVPASPSFPAARAPIPFSGSPALRRTRSPGIVSPRRSAASQGTNVKARSTSTIVSAGSATRLAGFLSFSSLSPCRRHTPAPVATAATSLPRLSRITKVAPEQRHRPVLHGGTEQQDHEEWHRERIRPPLSHRRAAANGPASGLGEPTTPAAGRGRCGDSRVSDLKSVLMLESPPPCGAVRVASENAACGPGGAGPASPRRDLSHDEIDDSSTDDFLPETATHRAAAARSAAPASAGISAVEPTGSALGIDRPWPQRLHCPFLPASPASTSNLAPQFWQRKTMPIGPVLRSAQTPTARAQRPGARACPSCVDTGRNCSLAARARRLTPSSKSRVASFSRFKRSWIRVSINRALIFPDSRAACQSGRCTPETSRMSRVSLARPLLERRPRPSRASSSRRYRPACTITFTGDPFERDRQPAGAARPSAFRTAPRPIPTAWIRRRGTNFILTALALPRY